MVRADWHRVAAPSRTLTGTLQELLSDCVAACVSPGAAQHKEAVRDAGGAVWHELECPVAVRRAKPSRTVARHGAGGNGDLR